MVMQRIMNRMSTPTPNFENDFDGFPPTDETGNVDVSLVEYCLSLTPAQRVEKHYHARLFAERCRAAARERYGPIVDAIPTSAVDV